MSVANVPSSSDLRTAAYSIEKQLIEFLRSAEIDLGSRSSIKAVRAELTKLIRAWNDKFTSRTIENESEFCDLVLRNLIGFGPIEPLLEEDSIWEISINSPKEIFCKRHDGPILHISDSFHDLSHLERVLSRMIETSVGSSRQLDPSLGVQDAQLPDGTRLHIIHPELTQNLSFAVSIRKFAKNSLSSIAEIVEKGSLSPQAGDFLFRAASQGATILISGAPGSGKTTLLNALIDAIPDQKRIVAIEETPEMKIFKPDKVHLHTRVDRPGHPEISLRDLVKTSLRMNPEALILGEVRDLESLPMLLCLSTGIQGISTIHASSPRDSLIRLRLLVQLSIDHDVPMWTLNQIIADSIDVVVHLERIDSSIVVDEIVAVEEGSRETETGFITTDIFKFNPAHSTLEFSGHNPLRLKDLAVDKSLDQTVLTNKSKILTPTSIDSKG